MYTINSKTINGIRIDFVMLEPGDEPEFPDCWYIANDDNGNRKGFKSNHEARAFALGAGFAGEVKEPLPLAPEPPSVDEDTPDEKHGVEEMFEEAPAPTEPPAPTKRTGRKKKIKIPE